MQPPKKSLGQHWLFDKPTLDKMAAAGEVGPTDVVLEIGPGLGSLTQLLAKRAQRVVAIEKDERLASQLISSITAKNLEITATDIMKFDLSKLPADYKLIANIPYYLTSNLLRRLLEDNNPPKLMALMVQKEVAQRIVAQPGQMSVLAFSVQYFTAPHLVEIVPRELFEPPPKVDSAILQLKRRSRPVFAADTKQLFRLVKAGFAGKRKQLKNSLAAGMHLTASETAKYLYQAGIDPTWRAQNLSLSDWQRLYRQLEHARHP